jgi:hypothetical protein
MKWLPLLSLRHSVHLRSVADQNDPDKMRHPFGIVRHGQDQALEQNRGIVAEVITSKHGNDDRVLYSTTPAPVATASGHDDRRTPPLSPDTLLCWLASTDSHINHALRRPGSVAIPGGQPVGATRDRRAQP